MPDIERECPIHGLGLHMSRGARKGFRCRRCLSESVTRRRRKVRATLILEAGGACALCGYAKCAAALEFHHTDANKESRISGSSRGLAWLRREVAKCVLVCANCHREIHAGATVLPLDALPLSYA